MKLFYGLTFIFLILFGIKISNILIKKVRLNRWVLAFTAPLVIIIPMVFFDITNPWILNMLIIVFSIMCIMFFEISKGVIEQREKMLKKHKNR